MAPGGRSRRRRPRARIAVVVVVLGTLALLAPSPTAALARAPREGEAGSGPPPLPVVLGPGERFRAVTNGEAIAFSDVDATDAWAAKAIRHVSVTNDWMRDFAPEADGTYPFRPDSLETRKYFARSLVKAFAPTAEPDPAIVFSDLDPSTSWYRYANIAVASGWMTRTKDGGFLPDRVVTMNGVHRALVLALGLQPAVAALNGIDTDSAQGFTVPRSFGTTMLGLRLGLRYNFPSGSESLDVAPKDPLPRSYVAYSLFRATTLPSWAVTDLLDQYASVTLPNLDPRQLEIVRWGLRYVGYPYYWGGEWGIPNESQTRTGFDCSGLVWWLLRGEDVEWEVVPPRPYTGWSLPERASADMARATVQQLSYDELRPGDLMFYDGNRDGIVDHVDMYIGNGYALDSSNTPGGVTVMWVGSGWYFDRFVYGRRVLTGEPA